MKKNGNNKGFTLVEVIIAVVILGIVFSPLISNFIQAARLNQKARKELNATTMAQNVMEGMSSMSGETVENAYQKIASAANPADAIDAIEALKVLPVGMIYDASTVSFVKNSDQKYTITYKNVAGARNTEYDVEIVLDASGHTTYNQRSMANIASMNGAYDCLWSDTRQDQVTAIENLFSLLGETRSRVDISKSYKREMIIDIKDVNAGGASDPNYAVEFTNTYTSGGVNYTPITVAKYYSQSTGQDPRNIYVYFWPNYYGNNLAYRDSIVVNNEAGLPVNIYLIRMSVDETEYSLATTAANEMNYEIDLTCTGVYNQDTKICTNMYENIFYSHEDNVKKDADGFYVNSYYKESRVNVSLPSSWGDEADLMTDASGSKSTNRIYDATVTVKDPTTGEKLAEFTGGTLQ